MRLFEIKIELIEEVIDNIQYNCSDAIDAYKRSKRVLWRGVRRNKNAPFYKFGQLLKSHSPEKRKSISVNQTSETFKIINDALKTLNFEARRDNIICCSSDWVHASHYTSNSALFTNGQLYMIFPINGFNFIWSDKFKDFGGVTTNKLDLVKMENIDDAQKIISNCGFRKDNFVAALKSGNEIGINGEYIAIGEKYYKRYKKYFKEILGFNYAII